MGTRLNGVLMQTTNATDMKSARLYVSRHEHRKGWLKPLEGHVNCETVGSCAFKLACVAAGICDGTLTVNPRSEWDVAAGVLLVEEAGGVVTDASGKPYAFNRQNVLVAGVAAAGAALHPALLTLTELIR